MLLDAYVYCSTGSEAVGCCGCCRTGVLGRCNPSKIRLNCRAACRPAPRLSARLSPTRTLPSRFRDSWGFVAVLELQGPTEVANSLSYPLFVLDEGKSDVALAPRPEAHSWRCGHLRFGDEELGELHRPHFPIGLGDPRPHEHLSRAIRGRLRA